MNKEYENLPDAQKIIIANAPPLKEEDRDPLGPLKRYFKRIVQDVERT